MYLDLSTIFIIINFNNMDKKVGRDAEKKLTVSAVFHKAFGSKAAYLYNSNKQLLQLKNFV